MTRRATGKGAVVYVMDTGIWPDHSELEDGKVIGGINPRNIRCEGQDASLHPCWTADSVGSIFLYTHGTAVASVIAGRNTGVAPDAKIVSVLAQDGTVSLFVESLRAMIAHAWDPTTPSFQTAIVNISGGVPSFDRGNVQVRAFEELMRRMIGGVDRDGNPDPNGKRFFFVGIAGNDLPDDRSSQCNADDTVKIIPSVLGREIDGLITVGGLTRDNQEWSGACRGDKVEILAPAHEILVASITGRDHYRSARPANGNSGTSYAGPYISGLAACLLEENPSLTPAQLEARLKANASGRVGIYATERPARRRAAGPGNW